MSLDIRATIGILMIFQTFGNQCCFWIIAEYFEGLFYILLKKRSFRFGVF